MPSQKPYAPPAAPPSAQLFSDTQPPILALLRRGKSPPEIADAFKHPRLHLAPHGA